MCLLLSVYIYKCFCMSTQYFLGAFVCDWMMVSREDFLFWEHFWRRHQSKCWELFSFATFIHMGFIYDFVNNNTHFSSGWKGVYDGAQLLPRAVDKTLGKKYVLATTEVITLRVKLGLKKQTHFRVPFEEWHGLNWIHTNVHFADFWWRVLLRCFFCCKIQKRTSK